jgi:hypothetical protein
VIGLRLRAAFAAFLLGWAGCGGGTDVDNALVQGQVRDGTILVASARVTLMPEDYNPVMGDPTGRTRTMLSEQDGKFAFPDLAPGNYSLEVVHPTSQRMDWIERVTVTAGMTVNLTAALDTARSIVVRLPDSTAADAYVFIPGTSVHAMRDLPGSEARFTLTHVPADSIPTLGIGFMTHPGDPDMIKILLPPGRADTSLLLASPQHAP